MDKKEILFWIDKAKAEKWDALDLSKNHISRLPAEIGELTALKFLDVSSTGLQELPHEIGRLRGLISLDLSNNNLTALPPEIGELAGLTSLVLTGNQLAALPPEIGDLDRLGVLSLADNALTELPREIGRLRSLKVLALGDVYRGNFLSALPPEIADLQQLTELYLSNNLLSEFPLEITALAGLNALAIARNRLTALPEAIGRLTELVDLALNGNQIAALPESIKNLTHLETLDLHRNPLPIPPEILERANDPIGIFIYYFGLQKIKHRRLMEAKVIVVGQGSVGKTSLVRRLTENKYDPHESKTDGIVISRWQVDDRSRTRAGEIGVSFSRTPARISLNLWDFGGQEIMHATHQFFLTRRSLYLLVLDARLTQEENRVEYWLKIIQSFGGESPVLVVANKIDQHPLDIDRTGLQKKYPNIAGILETSAATGAGVVDVKLAIAAHIRAMPHVRDLLPEPWFTVKARLEQLGHEKNFITRDEYLALCVENQIDDETSQRTLIGFLHDLGVVLHFQDDPRLEALGILNPQWVTNGVYRILNAHELFEQQGRLDLPLLHRILDDPDYPRDRRIFIVDMMGKFELCYPIDEKVFLVPDLLPKDEPYTGEWDAALAFQFHYNVLPSSVISRFIVRMNPFIHKTVWRAGVVLKQGGNTALVRADGEERRITIQVAGQEHTRRDFLSAIRIQLDAIHRTIAKLEARGMVPVPAHPEVAPVDYQFLLRLERDGRDSFPVQSGDAIVDVDVHALLNGIEPEKTRAGDRGGLHVGGNITNSTIIIGDENQSG